MIEFLQYAGLAYGLDGITSGGAASGYSTNSAESYASSYAEANGATQDYSGDSYSGSGSTAYTSVTSYSNTSFNTSTSYSNAQPSYVQYSTFVTSFSASTNTTTTTQGTSFFPTSTTYSSSGTYGPAGSSSSSSTSGFTSTDSSDLYTYTQFSQISTVANSTGISSTGSMGIWGEPLYNTVYVCDSILDIIWVLTANAIGAMSDRCTTVTQYTDSFPGNTLVISVSTATAATTLAINGQPGFTANLTTYATSTYSYTYSDDSGTSTVTYDDTATTGYSITISTVNVSYIPAKTTTATSFVGFIPITTTTQSSFSQESLSALGLNVTSVNYAQNSSRAYTQLTNVGTTVSVASVTALTQVLGTSQAIGPYQIIGAGQSYSETYVDYSTNLTGYSINTNLGVITVNYKYIASTLFQVPSSNLNVSAGLYANLIANQPIYYPFISQFETCPVYIPVVYPDGYQLTALESTSTTASATTGTGDSTTSTASKIKASWSYSWSSGTLNFTSQDTSTSTPSTASVTIQAGPAAANAVSYSYDLHEQGYIPGISNLNFFGGLFSPEDQSITIEIPQGIYNISKTDGASTSSYNLIVDSYTTTTANSSQNYEISGVPYVSTGFGDGAVLTYNSAQQLEEERIF